MVQEDKKMIEKEPRMEWSDIIAGALIYLGILCLLFCLHIVSIQSTGNLADVMATAFSVFLTIYIVAVIFGFVGILVQFLRWLTWSVKTADWKKKEARRYR